MLKLDYVDELPERARKHKLQAMIEEFCESGRKVAKIDLTKTDYKTPLVGYKCIYVAAKNSKRPVDVIKHGDYVYLTKI